jgi:hypothetical protein
LSSTPRKRCASNLSRLEDCLGSIDVFEKLDEEKLEELADAIYMAAVRARLKISDAIHAIRRPGLFDEKFFRTSRGNLFDYVDSQYQDFARRLLLKKAGGGTPNAAMGKGELLLLTLSPNTSKPVSGDIEYKGRTIEIKVNGGKLGLGSGQVANNAVVNFCRQSRLSLRTSTVGKQSRGQTAFDPTKLDDRQLLGKHLGQVLAVWWNAITDAPLGSVNPRWKTVRKRFLEVAAAEQFQKTDEILVLSNSGDFRRFRTKDEFVSYYNNDVARFEYRTHQKNPFSVYLDVGPHGAALC